MKKILLCLAFAAVFAAPASAEPLTRDLGKGLGYCRVHSLPADLPPVSAKRGAVILDLRYARGEEGTTAALAAWLKTRSAVAPAFVLLNAETAPAILDYFSAHGPVAGLVTLGAAAPNFSPDIALKLAPAAERTAYDALETGTPVEALLTDPTTKIRHDEASMAQDSTAADEESEAPDLADPVDTAPPSPVFLPPVIDYVLLRAVHLHRALVAMRKI